MASGHGQMRRAVRTTKQDPHLRGWLHLDGQRLAVSAWARREHGGSLVLALVPWSGRARGCGSGELRVAEPQPGGPGMIGKATWGGHEFELAVWVGDPDQPSEQHLRLVAQSSQQIRKTTGT